MEFLTFYKIPVGDVSETVVEWLKLHTEKLLNATGAVSDFCLGATQQFLTYPPSVTVFGVLLAFVALTGWYNRLAFIVFFSLLVLADYLFFPVLRPLAPCGIVAGVGFFWFKRRALSLSSLELVIATVIMVLALIDWIWLAKLWPPQLVLVALFAALAWLLQARWSVVFLTVACLLFIINQGYWQDTVATLAVVIWACIFCMGFGIPVGIVGAHHPRFYRVLQPVLDLMQTVPAYVYLIPVVFFFNIGLTPGLIATLVFVLPAPIRLTEVGIRSTPKTLLEAGQAFGAGPWTLLWKVELPHALPQIRISMTQTIMLSLSMVVISATAGGEGLGVNVFRALQSGDTALGAEAGFVIAIVAIMLDRLFRPGKGQ